MKKNLFLLLMLLCSVTFFTACSDDENDNWKNIPTDPINGENVALTVNGVTSDGSIQFTPQSATQGKVDLTNVFPGYSTVSVNVALEEQADGSFNFSGEQGLTTPPSMLAKSVGTTPVIMTVKVKGNITVAGAVSMTATSALSDDAMGGLSGSWNLLGKVDTDEYMTEIKSSPFILRWPAIKVVQKPGTDGEQIARIGSVIVSHILAEVLGQVTFNPDGNVTAKYYSSLPFDGDSAMEWIVNNAFNIGIKPSHTDWYESPKNLAYWYVKDNKLYIVPNIDMILKQVSQDNGGAEIAGGDLSSILEMLSKLGIDLTQLDPAIIAQVTEWLSTGIPLNYRTTEAGLEVYVDKAMVDPFMPILFTMLPGLQEQLDKMAEENPLIGMLPLLLSLNKLTDIETIWNTNTKEFELGIGFAK